MHFSMHEAMRKDKRRLLFVFLLYWNVLVIKSIVVCAYHMIRFKDNNNLPNANSYCLSVDLIVLPVTCHTEFAFSFFSR